MDYLRQLGILDPKNIIFPITIIGCGGIGSFTALLLAIMGCPRLTLVDPDSVEDHNLPNQLFPKSAKGQKKVEACRDLICQFSNCLVETIQDKFGDCQPGIVISGVDSMKSRKEIWEKIKFNPDVPLYIDARLGAELVQVFTVQPNSIEDIEMYEKFLYPDESLQELPCTARAIIYTGFSVASLIGSQLKKWLNDNKYPRRLSFDIHTLTLDERR